MKNENENKKGNEGADNFSVPENYFKESASAIFNKVEWQEEHRLFPSLVALKQKRGLGNGFSVPQNYFSQKENGIERLQHPILGMLNKDTCFSVPENYFEKKQTQLISLIGKTKQTRVISLFKKRSYLAVAALFVISLGFWIYTSYAPSTAVEDCGTLACIEKEDLVKSINLENFENEDLYELLNTSDLEMEEEQKPNSSGNTNQPDSGTNTRLNTSL